MNEAGFEKVKHIFGGIPEVLFDSTAEPNKNFNRLISEFLKFGINIDPTAKIANSTLKKMLDLVNNILRPEQELPEELKLLLNGATMDDNSVAMLKDIGESKDKRDLNINIGSDVEIGEGVGINTSVKIGDKTKIGEGTVISYGVNVGKDCEIGNNVFLSINCNIGDNSTVLDRVVFKKETTVPRNSLVSCKGDTEHYKDSTIARIEPKIKIVQ